MDSIELLTLEEKSKNDDLMDVIVDNKIDDNTWDVCAVFDFPLKKQKEIAVKISTINDLLFRAGLHTTSYLSAQHDEIYMLIGASEARLAQEAERTEYMLSLNPKTCLERGRDLGMRLAVCTDDPDSVNITEDIWTRNFGKFEVDKSFLFQTYDSPYPVHQGSVLRTSDRVKLTISIIEAEFIFSGASLDIAKLLSDSKHPLIALFPLHEREELAKLRKDWISCCACLNQPLARVREYFGEKVAIYFAWETFYCKWLILPALIGFFFFVSQIALGSLSPDIPGLIFFAVFTALWSTFFLEFWKRKEASWKVTWGMWNFIDSEQPRPGFIGEWVISPINGKKTPTFSFFEKIKRMVLSQTVLMMLIGLVVGSVILIFSLRAVLIETSVFTPTTAAYVSGLINAIQIQIMNYVYGLVASKLNDYENHRTDTEYENSLITKSFLFKFFNSYNTLFYIAFLKRYESEENYRCFDYNDTTDESLLCMTQLQQQLITIFILSIVINNLLEIGWPWLARKFQAWRNQRGVDSAVSKSIPEKEYERASYDSTFDDFDEMAVQFGYVTLFVAAFPLAPFFALLNNVFEIPLDASKLCNHCRRPEPRGMENIGTWYTIMNIISFIAVLSNVGICCFTANQLEFIDPQIQASTKVWIFLCTEHIVFLSKFVIQFFIPDEPTTSKERRLRSSFITDVLLSNKEEIHDHNNPNSTTKASISHEDFMNLPVKLPEDGRYLGPTTARPLSAPSSS